MKRTFDNRFPFGIRRKKDNTPYLSSPSGNVDGGMVRPLQGSFTLNRLEIPTLFGLVNVSSETPVSLRRVIGI